ncbi:unnamed protein product [Musa banksii]
MGFSVLKESNFSCVGLTIAPDRVHKKPVQTGPVFNGTSAAPDRITETDGSQGGSTRLAGPPFPRSKRTVFPSRPDPRKPPPHVDGELALPDRCQPLHHPQPHPDRRYETPPDHLRQHPRRRHHFTVLQTTLRHDLVRLESHSATRPLQQPQQLCPPPGVALRPHRRRHPGHRPLPRQHPPSHHHLHQELLRRISVDRLDHFAVAPAVRVDPGSGHFPEDGGGLIGLTGGAEGGDEVVEGVEVGWAEAEGAHGEYNRDDGAAAAKGEPVEGEGVAGLPGRGAARSKGRLEDGEGGGEEDGGGGRARNGVGEREGEKSGVGGVREAAGAEGSEGLQEVGNGGGGEGRGKEGEVGEGVRVRVRVGRAGEEEVRDVAVVS